MNALEYRVPRLPVYKIPSNPGSPQGPHFNAINHFKMNQVQRNQACYIGNMVAASCESDTYCWSRGRICSNNMCYGRIHSKSLKWMQLHRTWLTATWYSTCPRILRLKEPGPGGQFRLAVVMGKGWNAALHRSTQKILYISPHSETTTAIFGLLPWPVLTFSILRTTSSPSPITRPNTTCFPSNQSVFAQEMKNWQPFVLGPLLAMESSPGPVCLPVKFSSLNLVP
mmetsp:Transcript_18963/g.22697  ORF Transcript_18963/g.22697 Transcript_18963/m.22697 type:complete len:226 (+) Transcript_18963:230-907(+)